MTEPPRIAVVGVHGYGAAHVLAAKAAEAQGRARLVGLVDPVRGPIERDGRRLAAADLPPYAATLAELRARTPVDVVVIATPLHTHADLAEQALRGGADVLLEKPPVTDLAQLARLTAVQRDTGGLVQVGFQSLGSHAVAALGADLAAGRIGEVTAIGAVGSWTRDRGYWLRAPWAGRRTLHGVPVGDGAVSNPFAHALMTALRVARWEEPAAVGAIASDLRRANPIEADDTSALTIDAGDVAPGVFGGRITCAFTLAGPREDAPFVLVQGTRGVARLDYTLDRLRFDDGPVERFGRDDLLDDLLAARAQGTGLISPLRATGAFVRVLDELAHRPVRAIAPQYVDWQGRGDRARPVVELVAEAARRAVDEQRVFRELTDVPWA